MDSVDPVPLGARPSAWKRALKRVQNFVEICSEPTRQIGIWILSIIATLILPCLPLGIELFRAGKVTSDTIYVTAAILSASFAFTAEHVLFFCMYLLLFVVTLLLDLETGPQHSFSLEAWAGTLLFVVSLLHATERFWWHVVLDRPFPERLSWSR